MTPSFPRAPLGVLALGAAMALAVGSAQAQGTDAQREACTPDALKLCQKTIPDIDKTTACMKAHFSQLSPRCKVAFNDVTGGKAERPRSPRREAVTPPPADTDAAQDTDTDTDSDTDVAVDAPRRTPGVTGYEAQIRGYCRDGLIDPYTCRNTLAALRGSE